MPSYIPILTARQRETLEYIRECFRETGMPPTVRQIAGEFGLASPSTVHAHLQNLVRLGKLYTRDVKGYATYFPTVEIPSGQSALYGAIGLLRAGAELEPEAIDEIERLLDILKASGWSGYITADAALASLLTKGATS